jgi:hypothetical protein
MAIYNEYTINKIVDCKIKKYIRYYKRNGSNLDLLSEYQINAENDCLDKLRSKNFIYNKECEEKDNIINLIQNRFDFYFKIGNFYSWLNGNNNFKKLLDC